MKCNGEFQTFVSAAVGGFATNTEPSLPWGLRKPSIGGRPSLTPSQRLLFGFFLASCAAEADAVAATY